MISQGGAEKSRIVKQCYYGADGNVQKVQVSQNTNNSKKGPPGVLPMGKLAKKAGESKKEEVTAYMKSAAELVHAYVPPDPARVRPRLPPRARTTEGASARYFFGCDFAASTAARRSAPTFANAGRSPSILR